MVSIPIEKFADMAIDNIKDMDRRELIKPLKSALSAKKNGAGCTQYGSHIWVAGMNMCFACMTLEADSCHQSMAGKRAVLADGDGGPAS